MIKANFHTHTYRCGHAVGHEKEYIEAALRAGYDRLGFSDHSPWPVYLDTGVRMHDTELEGYVSSLRELREQYRGTIDIRIGLECEYFPSMYSWMTEMKQQYGLDYILLGNHFDGSKQPNGLYFGNATEPAEAYKYLEMTLKGMQTGAYTYLCHPELFLRSYPEWDTAAAEVSRELCRASNALQMPVEFNLEGVRSMSRGGQKGIGYPHENFWRIAAEENCRFVIGCDAHRPDDLYDEKNREAALRHLTQDLGLTFIESAL